MRLGVNIDHIATLRQARKESFPDPVHAALVCEMHGADQITCHLREDRRHIQDKDLEMLKGMIKTRLNLEMAVSPEIVEIACRICPHQITLVPEKRSEVTTEGGLDVSSQKKELKKLVSRFKKLGIRVSMFIDPDQIQVKSSAEIGADAVELHTGSYALSFSKGDPEKEWMRLKQAAFCTRNSGMLAFAGHGLDYYNVEKILEIEEIEELNIGFSIVARAVFTGLPEAVREMKTLIRR